MALHVAAQRGGPPAHAVDAEQQVQHRPRRRQQPYHYEPQRGGTRVALVDHRVPRSRRRGGHERRRERRVDRVDQGTRVPSGLTSGTAFHSSTLSSPSALASMSTKMSISAGLAWASLRDTEPLLFASSWSKSCWRVCPDCKGT